jgi:hypothetical protein
MEKDDEIYGNGNLYTAEFWEYDARLGRRWNIDPVINPSESGYATFRNNPIVLTDPDGDCADCKEEEPVEPAENQSTNDNIKINDLPKANNVGEFLVGAVDKLKTGDKISGTEIKDFINPSPDKGGEKELGEILDKIDYLGVTKDGNKTTLTVNLKDNAKSITKTIKTPDGDFKITVKTGTELVIKKKSATEVSLDVNKLSVTKLGWIDVSVPLGAIGVKIDKNEVAISALGITVVKKEVVLPKKLKK